MITINDIIRKMFENTGEHCLEFVCADCPKEFFCWANSRLIAIEYIKREGTI